jgi:hypothetical protein
VKKNYLWKTHDKTCTQPVPMAVGTGLAGMGAGTHKISHGLPVKFTTCQRDHQIGKSNRMILGTGAMAIEMEDCRPGAFELAPLLEKWESKSVQN